MLGIIRCIDENFASRKSTDFYNRGERRSE